MGYSNVDTIDPHSLFLKNTFPFRLFIFLNSVEYVNLLRKMLIILFKEPNYSIIQKKMIVIEAVGKFTYLTQKKTKDGKSLAQTGRRRK